MPQRVLDSIDELKALTGREIAIGDWVEITQERIDLFAEATGDPQWIHVDVDRCRSESPFGVFDHREQPLNERLTQGVAQLQSAGPHRRFKRP